MLWTLKKIGYRVVNYGMKPGIPLMPFPKPELISGAGSLAKLPDIIQKAGVSNVLLVTDPGIVKAGLIEKLKEDLEHHSIKFTVFDRVQPNPSILNVEDGLKEYQEKECKGLIAFGGGSAMDCAKGIGARATNPNKSILAMKGLFKVKKAMPPFFAVPTTAGTGSETTIAAVITDSENHEKFVIKSMKVCPEVAVLDPELMKGLPPHITSTTGMDAMTHAVEAYIGLHGTSYTNDLSEKAVRLIFENLEDVYKDGSDLEKRNNMAIASFYAGAAFTRAQVGYVHAIAHNLGGIYGVPHGLANAVILPYILEYSREAAEGKIARLAIAGGFGKNGESPETLSKQFIEKIKELNANLDIPTTIPEIQEKDVSLIAQRALAEANPDYPVPKIMTQQECETLIRKLIP